jgi:hypothetical protein
MPIFGSIDSNLSQVTRVVVSVLVGQANDLQSLRMVLAIQLFQYRSLIVAIRTPGAKDVHNDRFAFELRAALIHNFARQVHSRETKRLLLIFNSGQAPGLRIGIGAGDILASTCGEGCRGGNPRKQPLQTSIRLEVAVLDLEPPRGDEKAKIAL